MNDETFPPHVPATPITTVQATASRDMASEDAASLGASNGSSDYGHSSQRALWRFPRSSSAIFPAPAAAARYQPSIGAASPPAASREPHPQERCKEKERRGSKDLIPDLRKSFRRSSFAAKVTANVTAAAEAAAERVAAARNASSQQRDFNEDWLDSMLPGFSQRGRGGRQQRFTLDVYLTELCNRKELKWLILPFGTKRAVWDSLMIVLVLYTAVMLPYLLTFADGVPTAAWTRSVDIASDFIFMVDIVLNFNTGIVNKNTATLITDKRTIARMYAFGWFPIDAAGSIPWEIVVMISEASGTSNSVSVSGLQVIKVLKAPKLLRLVRLFKLLSRLDGAPRGPSMA